MLPRGNCRVWVGTSIVRRSSVLHDPSVQALPPLVNLAQLLLKVIWTSARAGYYQYSVRLHFTWLLVLKGSQWSRRDLREQ
jgi:hypothetical protein